MRTAIVRLSPRRGEGEHAGLLLNRYLAEAVAGGGNPDERVAVLNAARDAMTSPALAAVYKLAFDRWDRTLTGAVDVATPNHGRLIIGLGTKGVIESGLRVHHTYGVPLLPGSALKGVAAHYAHEVWKGEYVRDHASGFHRTLFGTTDESGCIRFEDGWAVPGQFTLHRDVMTPHHLDWQTKDVAPTDFDGPNPVPYLSVSGTFRLGLSWQGPADANAEAWLKRTRELLLVALAERGIGGKTSSGYGRLVVASAEASKPPALTADTPRRVGDRVTVKVLERRPDMSGKPCFRVEEAGGRPGLLTDGKPPATLPEVNTDRVVYRSNMDRNSPRYSWDEPAVHQAPSAKRPPNRR